LPTKSLTHGGTLLAKVIRELYDKGQTDYSFEPLILVDPHSKPVGRIQDGDAVVFCCRRGEREVQLTEAFTEETFTYFPRHEIKDLTFVILTLYHEKFKDLPVAFAPTKINDTLSEVISKAGLRQLHLSESEKFSHVTFFFNGGNNHPFAGEEDLCIPSITGIPVDQVPQLSLPQVTEQVKEGISRGYDFIVVNFANGDVIGHTHNKIAKEECARQVDTHLHQVVEAAMKANYVVMVTADHGNLEEMTNPDGTANCAHSTNPVPFLLIDLSSSKSINLHNGKLADVAPTVLSFLNITQPVVMDGVSLAPRHRWGEKRRVLLIILDGWGIGKQDSTNPIWLAHIPEWEKLNQSFPGCRLEAAGESVGLQPGKAGNSEAGHINLGAGRVVLQDDVRLDLAMQDGTFYSNKILCSAIQKIKQKNNHLHLICLLSEKSSHGTIQYPLAILQMAKSHGLEQVYLHVIFDGRSTQPGSAPELLERFDQQISEIGIGNIVSGIGRGIALDRDGNYTKTQIAYNAFVIGDGRKVHLD
jgi:2,3-bisphosphoglycerate-independent phosphoglycerate mutase